MSMPPVDFGPLEPAEGDRHWEGLARRIEALAAPELARRAQARPTVTGLLQRRARPLLAAAAALIVLAGVELFRVRQPDPAALTIAALAGVSYESAEGLLGNQPGPLGGLISTGK